jgi:hypothetical protein
MLDGLDLEGYTITADKDFSGEEFDQQMTARAPGSCDPTAKRAATLGAAAPVNTVNPGQVAQRPIPRTLQAVGKPVVGGSFDGRNLTLVADGRTVSS